MALQGMAGPYGYGMQPMQQGPSPYGMTPYGMPAYSPQVTGGPYGQPAATGPYPAVPSPYPSPYQQQQQQQPQPVQLMQQQQQQQLQVLGGFGATSPPASAGGTGGGVLSPTNPFATVAPAPAAGGVANPFQSPAVSAGGAAAASVDQEWNTFFSDNRWEQQVAGHTAAYLMNFWQVASSAAMAFCDQLTCRAHTCNKQQSRGVCLLALHSNSERAVCWLCLPLCFQ